MSPALITVTVPTRIDFSIDPSKPEDDMFQSATGKITVDCGYDLKMDLLGIKAADGTTAKVVAQDKFENWNDLSQEDTVSHIALGIRKPILAAIWSKPEEGNLLNTSCGSYTLDDGDHSINLVAKYGRMWPENTTLQYNVYLRFSLAE